jgi:hypothetical protein
MLADLMQSWPTVLPSLPIICRSEAAKASTDITLPADLESNCADG